MYISLALCRPFQWLGPVCGHIPPTQHHGKAVTDADSGPHSRHGHHLHGPQHGAHGKLWLKKLTLYTIYFFEDNNNIGRNMILDIVNKIMIFGSKTVSQFLWILKNLKVKVTIPTKYINSMFFKITLLSLFFCLKFADRNWIIESSQSQAAEFSTAVQGKQIWLELSFLVNAKMHLVTE